MEIARARFPEHQQNLKEKKLRVNSTGKDFEKYDRYMTGEKARFRDRTREREGVGFAWDFRIQVLKMNRV